MVKSNKVNLLGRTLKQNRATTVAAALLLLLTALTVWTLFSPRSDARLDTIRQNGFPITLSELNAWYRAVPDGQNNALFYEKAFASLRSSGAPEFFDKLTSRNAQGWVLGRVLSAQDKHRLAELLATNDVALRLLHSAKGSNRCRYSVDMSRILSPHQTGDNDFKVLEGVELLCAEALMHSANGDSQQAIRSFLAAGLLADSLADKPLVRSQLLRLACLSKIVTGLERALTLTQMTDEQFISLQVMLAEAERPQALLRALVGEQALGIAEFADAVETVAPSQGNYPAGQTERLEARFGVGLSKGTGFFRRDQAFYLDVMATNIAAASLPFPARVKVGQAIPSVVPCFCVVSRHVLLKISAIFSSEANVNAWLRIARTAIAVERFRRGHRDALPAGLEALAPSYSLSVPADPFNGDSLRFEIQGARYVIYSSGSGKSFRIER